MDNVSCVDRSKLPSDCTAIDQVDGSAWVAFFAICMLRMAVELSLVDSRQKSLYEDQAIIYLKHFCRLRKSLNDVKSGLWDSSDMFFYDRLHLATQEASVSLRIRSLVGLVPLIAVHAFRRSHLSRLPRLAGLLTKSMDASMQSHCAGDCIGLSLVGKHQLQGLLRYLLSEDEFLSLYGIRSLSKYHLANPFSLKLADGVYRISYCPAESTSMMFGGNSNWRGPVWLSINYLLVEALDTYALFCDDLMTSHHVTGRGGAMSLLAAATDIRRRLVSIFLLNSGSQRPLHAGASLGDEERWRELVLFYEFYNPETGQGHGASHQTGWSALIASILMTSSRRY